MQGKMKEMGGPKPDDRMEVKLPDTIKRPPCGRRRISSAVASRGRAPGPRGGGEPHAAQPVAQQGERMPAEREAEARIVGDEVLAFGRQAQARRGLDHRRIAE